MSGMMKNYKMMQRFFILIPLRVEQFNLIIPRLEMINLLKLTNDLLDGKNLGENGLKQFVDAHLIKLSSNNPNGMYNHLIIESINKYHIYFGQFTNETTKMAIGKALEANMQVAKNALLTKIIATEEFIGQRFGTSSNIYLAFFPNTLQQYINADSDELIVLVSQLFASASKHLMDNYPQKLIGLETLIENFKKHRKVQQALSWASDSQLENQRANRKALTTTITKNLLIIAADHIGDTVGFKKYFNTRYMPIDSTGNNADEDFEDKTQDDLENEFANN